MIAAASPRPAAPLARFSAALLLAGVAAAVALRLAIAGLAGRTSPAGGAVFAAAALALAAAAGWRPSRPRARRLGAGVAGAVVLVAAPLALHVLHGPHAAPPLAGLPPWMAVVTAVAVAEEVLLRGVLFDAVSAVGGRPGAGGEAGAVAVTAAVFGLIHVPIYGWDALPLDAAVGVWLGGLRLLSGGVAAPAVAHTLADLAAWWLG